MYKQLNEKRKNIYCLYLTSKLVTTTSEKIDKLTRKVSPPRKAGLGAKMARARCAFLRLHIVTQAVVVA